MDQQQGYQFVEEVLTQVWQNYDLDKISDYYATDVQGEINGEAISIEDIRNNAKYHQQYSVSCASEILAVVTNEQQIMARVRQQTTMKSGEMKTSEIFVNYQLMNKKVARIYAVTYPNYDYKHR